MKSGRGRDATKLEARSPLESLANGRFQPVPATGVHPPNAL